MMVSANLIEVNYEALTYFLVYIVVAVNHDILEKVLNGR